MGVPYLLCSNADERGFDSDIKQETPKSYVCHKKIILVATEKVHAEEKNNCCLRGGVLCTPKIRRQELDIIIL